MRVPCASHVRESPIPVAMTSDGELTVRPKLFLSCCGMCVPFQLVTVALVFYVWLKKIARITISTW